VAVVHFRIEYGCFTGPPLERRHCHCGFLVWFQRGGQGFLSHSSTFQGPDGVVKRVRDETLVYHWRGDSVSVGFLVDSIAVDKASSPLVALSKDGMEW
jgi:hypothetical protein